MRAPSGRRPPLRSSTCCAPTRAAALAGRSRSIFRWSTIWLYTAPRAPRRSARARGAPLSPRAAGRGRPTVRPRDRPADTGRSLGCQSEDDGRRHRAVQAHDHGRGRPARRSQPRRMEHCPSRGGAPTSTSRSPVRRCRKSSCSSARTHTRTATSRRHSPIPRSSPGRSSTTRRLTVKQRAKQPDELAHVLAPPTSRTE